MHLRDFLDWNTTCSSSAAGMGATLQPVTVPRGQAAGIALSAFLLSCDLEALLLLKQALGRYGIQVTTCRSSHGALDVIKQKRFDLVVLDCELPGSMDLLGLLRNRGFGNHSLLALAGGERTTAELQIKQIRHILQKPFTGEAIARILKASCGLIVLEKRAYFRCALRISATATYEENGHKRPVQNAILCDLSHTGLRLKAGMIVPKDSRIFVDFILPGIQAQIHVVGTVVWNDPHGHAGVHFSLIPARELTQLRDWLNSQCPWGSELMPKIPAHLPAIAAH